MQNLYEIIRASLFFNKFLLNDVVCVEYTCPLDDEHMGIFSQHDYMIHVLSGKKTWKTIEGEWTVNAGETFFAKKGASIIHQYFDDDFCMLGFFLPDDLIRDSLIEEIKKVQGHGVPIQQFTATKLLRNDFLDGFFQSMLTYFRAAEQPPESLIRLKLKELLINIVVNSEHHILVDYIRALVENSAPSLTHIMESNFCYNLSLEEYAKLTHRSLSTFKRDFCNHYNMTPGKWLMEKRLAYAASLLLDQQMSITQIAFESGFKDVSHFSRVFKTQFGCAPTNYSNQ